MRLRPALVVVLVCAACGGGKQDNSVANKALDDLAKSKDELTRTKAQLDACTKEFAEYKAMAPTGPQEIVVRVDGEGVTIVGRVKKPAGDPTVGAGDLTEAEKNVVPLVIAQIQNSRNAIQQCYVQALKTTAGLENRAIPLTVQVKVTPSGAITSPQFVPEISPAFTACMNKVAERWKIKAYEGRAFPLQYPMKLQPVN